MNKRKKIEYPIVWLLATYIAMPLTLADYFSLKFDLGEMSKTFYRSMGVFMVAIAPEDSLGDGPGDRGAK